MSKSGTPRASGPYDTERDTYTEPMVREVRALHESGRVRAGDPDRLVSGTQLRYLEAACEAAGIVLGAYDRRILTWLAGWEASTVQVVVDLINRAGERR